MNMMIISLYYFVVFIELIKICTNVGVVNRLCLITQLKKNIQIKLLIETKPIVCLPWEILHYKISREKLEPEPDSNLGLPDF